MLDKIKSLFIVETEDTPKKASKTTPVVQKEVPEVESVDSTSSTSNEIPAGQVSNKFNKVLFGALEKNNLEGFDYLEFKQSLRSLSKMPMDDATRFQSAFAMAQTMGATTDKLIKGADHYLKVLQQEEQKFAAAVENQRASQIGGKEGTIKQLDTAIQKKRQQLVALEKEIKSHEAQKQKIAKEISGAKVKIEKTKRDFKVTYLNIVGQIRTDVENIKKYLGTKK